jgi:tRNA/rRNA methyltransferase
MHLSFILVKPRNPQNIGAAARAMGNFGFEDLRLINPWDPTWQEAKSAVGASPILKKAKVFNTIEEAAKDAHILIATTALKNRKPFQQILTLNKIDTFLKENKDKKIALLFGSEKTGLTAEDIDKADYILNIPTTAKVPSINLAQAVILCCWEFAKNNLKTPRANIGKSATIKEKEIAFNNLSILFDKLDLPPILNKKICTQKLQKISAAKKFTKEDIFFINSIVQKIIKKLD